MAIGWFSAASTVSADEPVPTAAEPVPPPPPVRVHMDLGDDNDPKVSPGPTSNYRSGGYYKPNATSGQGTPVVSDPEEETQVPHRRIPDEIMPDNDDACDEGLMDGPLHRFHDQLYMRGDFLLWWTKAASLPPLVTTGAAGNTAGDLGDPSTSVLFGGNEVAEGVHAGGRFTLGSWLDPAQKTGVEGTYLFLGTSAANYSTSDQSYPILARPFFNVSTGQQDSFLVAYPGDRTGTISVRDADSMYAFEVLMRRALIERPDVQLYITGGYRYANFSEDLLVESVSTFQNPAGVLPVGSTLNLADHFSTLNEFNGGEIGMSVKTERDRWTVDLLAKVALGYTMSRVSIDGSSNLNEPTVGSTITPGGLLALPTNMGTYRQNNFTFIPEIGATAEYQLTCHLKATIGYSLIYWNKVARPGDQIDSNVNPTQLLGGTLAGAANPQFNFATTDFWAQGVSFGLDYRY